MTATASLVRWNTAFFGAAALGLALSTSATARAADAPAAEGVSLRGIIRAGVDKGGKVHGKLAEIGLENATSLAYNVLVIDKNGVEQSVDEASHVFGVGQRFRISLECDSDVYLYVFHEGPDGARTLLVPDSADEGRVPMVQKGSRSVLPDDGSYFEVTPPVGKERL
ncbi:MAG: DUF4384 domain-containing protein, partial [Planctomycetia bacterium]